MRRANKGNSTWRHFKALCCKNMIVLKRTPWFTVCQVILPALLMGILCIIRSKVPIKYTSLTDLLKYKHPVYPPLRYDEHSSGIRKTTEWFYDHDYTTDSVEDFMMYNDYRPKSPFIGGGEKECEDRKKRRQAAFLAQFNQTVCDSDDLVCAQLKQGPNEVKQEKNYNQNATDHQANQTALIELDNSVVGLPPIPHPGNLECYEVEQDWMGPLYFAPNQCLSQTSFTHPKKTSPIIAYIDNGNDLTSDVEQYWKALTTLIKHKVSILLAPNFKTKKFNSEKDLFDYVQDPNYMLTRDRPGICFGFGIEQNGPDKYTSKLYFSDFITHKPPHMANGIPDQKKDVFIPQRQMPDMNSFENYQRRGFAYSHNVIANQVLKKLTGDNAAAITMMMAPVPGSVAQEDDFVPAESVLLPFFLLLGYIPLVYGFIFLIVREKENRVKETMRIMGMTDLPYWLSWFAFYTIVNTIVTTVSWGILLTNVVVFSSKGYMWLFFWLYGEAVFGQIIFLQSLFTGSKYAGIVSTVIYFAGVLLDTLITNNNATRAAKLGASLLPQVALMQGAAVFANYEGTGIGLNESTASIMYYNYSFITSLWMLFLDFIIFTALGLYLDKVIPSDFGQRLNPCFLCMPRYYRCCRRRRTSQVDGGDDEALLDGEYDDEFERAQMPNENYEAPPQICKQLEAKGDFLKVDNLQKTFSGGFRAVRGVSVKMFDSQIFAMLGHNGAGKTTVISMLTGLIEKSQGDAKCYDIDLFEEMDEVREFMGVCPQHDVLFDLLTPREHLDIFYDFKGGDPNDKQREIDALIQDVGLDIDQDKVVSTLSGGNKRKTSVCVALCGGSKLVMLDEPTAGMDLGARRNLWDMLKSYKKDRIIILTTHYMDEADVLGDRIGIMVQGQLQCIGSSLFLKNRFGVGYRITFVKKRRKSHPGLIKYMQSYFQGVQKAGEVHEEVSFVIPKSQSNNLGGFFDNLDTRLDEFDIRSYGVSMSNLEDVFLKINKEYAPDLFSDLSKFGHSDNTLSSSEWNKTKSNTNPHFSIGHSTQDNSNELMDDMKQTMVEKKVEQEIENEDLENLIRGSSCLRSCTASGAKRLIVYKRDWCGLLCQIVIPLVLVLFGLWLTSGPTHLVQSPPRPLSTGFYPYKQRILMNEQPVNMTNGDGTTDGNLMGADIAKMFPNSTEAFEVKYTGNMSYNEFYNEVYAARNEGEPYPYRFGSYQIYKASQKDNLYQVINFLNVTSQDVSALYPQYMYQAILRAATGNKDLEFNVVTTPFPIYQMFKDKAEASRALDFTFMTAVALALIPCVMVQFILNEREFHLKHQQLLSGMSLSGYWSSNLLFDIIMAYIPIGFIIMLTYIFGKNYEGVWVMFCLYPPAVVPFTYVMSFCFSSDINAQIFTLFIHFIAGAMGTAIVFTMQQIPEMMEWGDSLRWVFCLVPSFCVTHSIIWSSSGDLVRNTRIDATTSDGIPIPRQLPEPLWAWYNLKGDAVILVAHFVLGIIALWLIEMEVAQLFFWCPRISIRNCKSRPRTGPVLVKDDDVIEEERRVDMQCKDYISDDERLETEPKQLSDTEQPNNKAKDPTQMDCIRVNNFQMIYEPPFQQPVVAVRQASFGLDYGQCFALLGVNGAGKSTTFKSLTREIIPTTGEINIQGFNVQTQFADARKLIGYCPQYDAIFPVLTVEETLKFYALIKGIKTNLISSVVEKAITKLNLKDHKNKLAGNLSGGNKRKLNVAMALIGNPPIILLDEPSAGMDPEARRFMWQVVEKISQRDKRSAVVITTHSMEEAEALSTKLGIMVRGGVFRCMGSSQHIKNKFGVGYEVEIKVKKASYNELQDMAMNLNLPIELQQKVNLQQAIKDCDEKFDPLLLEQVRADGLGADLVLEAELAQNSGQVRLRNLLVWLNAQESGFKIIHWMCANFAQVELLEQCGEFFKLRVPKEDKTIGWLFGQLEHEKRSLGIQEYSVTQTTLEQIFQVFAAQSIASDKAAFTFRRDFSGKVILMNPDRQMTEEQERQSQRGLSFNENNSVAQTPKLQQSQDSGKGQRKDSSQTFGGADDDDDAPASALLSNQ